MEEHTQDHLQLSDGLEDIRNYQESRSHGNFIANLYMCGAVALSGLAFQAFQESFNVFPLVLIGTGAIGAAGSLVSRVRFAMKQKKSESIDARFLDEDYEGMLHEAMRGVPFNRIEGFSYLPEAHKDALRIDVAIKYHSMDMHDNADEAANGITMRHWQVYKISLEELEQEDSEDGMEQII